MTGIRFAGTGLLTFAVLTLGSQASVAGDVDADSADAERATTPMNIAARAALASPKVACWDMVGESRVVTIRKPRECGLVSAEGSIANYLIGFRWTKWKATSARGRGSSYRLWADVIVRLRAPRQVCGGRFFTQARVRYVGGDRRYWPDQSYRLRSC